MLHHDHGPGCLCHRVVRADGSLGNYAAGQSRLKAQVLRSEGVELDDDRVPAIPEKTFRTYRTTYPLATLRQIQETLASQVRLRGRRTMPRTVAGVDVSYCGDCGIGAYVLWDLAGQKLAWSTTVRLEIAFPYITGYLAFRELPVLLALLKIAAQSGRLADVVIVDGSGVVHPRGIGIACHLGLLASIPTIGVSKKLLCGEVDLQGMLCGQSRPILVDGRTRGIAMRPTSAGSRPIFISPGHRMSVEMAELIVRRQLLGRRLPEVQYWADRLSRSEGRRGERSLTGAAPADLGGFGRRESPF